MTHQRSRSWAGTPTTRRERSEEIAHDDLVVEDVVSEFLYVSLERRGHSAHELETVGLSHRDLVVDSPEHRLALRLQEIGDSLAHDDVLTRQLIDRLDGDQRYEVFRDVARRLIREEITWGRIAALFLFGVQLAETWMDRRPRAFGAVLCVVAWLSRFVVEELIEWISLSSIGGWRAVVNQVTQNYWWTVAIGGACTAAAVFLYFRH